MISESGRKLSLLMQLMFPDSVCERPTGLANVNTFTSAGPGINSPTF